MSVDSVKGDVESKKQANKPNAEASGTNRKNKKRPKPENRVTNGLDYCHKTKNFTVLGSLFLASYFAFTAYNQNIASNYYSGLVNDLRCNEKSMALRTRDDSLSERLLPDFEVLDKITEHDYDSSAVNNNLIGEPGAKKKSHSKKDYLETKIASLESEKEEYALIVYKSSQKARLFRINYSLLDEVPISTGKICGEKQREGDRKTPTGVYNIVSVENSSGWLHNNELAYGPFFLRLDCGSWNINGGYNPGGVSSIGIHGTNHPELLGTNVSEGCLRTPSDWLRFVVESNYLTKGSKVIILNEDFSMPYFASLPQSIAHGIASSYYEAPKNDVSLDYFKSLSGYTNEENKNEHDIKIKKGGL